MPRSRTSRPARGIAATGALIGALALAAPLAPARADDTASTMVVDGKVAQDGALTVSETLTFPGGAPAQLVQKLATTQDRMGTERFVYAIDQVAAKAGSTDLAPSVSTDNGVTTVTIDGSKAGKQPVTITYRVVGASSAAGQGQATTEVAWNVLQGLSVPVQKVSGTVTTPGTISYVTCESGAVGHTSPCGMWGGGTHDNPQPSFSDGPRAAGDVVNLSFGIPSSVVKPDATIKHRWSLDRAFSVTRASLLASLLPLLLGGALLYWLHRRHGRDQVSRAVSPVAEFTPVGPGQSRFTVLQDVRPGHVGTVADERVDPVDVTATILDLAVRGWLRIVELPRERGHQALDWRLERLEGGEGELRPFEARLRDAVAPADGQGVLVSQISPAVTGVVGQVQSDLYDDVVRRGWFERRPDQTRSRWTTIGWVALALAVLATVLLVVFTTFGLVGIALVALALGALVVGQDMPRRTSSGTALLGGLSALSSQLQTQPTDQMPHGDEYRELSRILPYAVVLGGRDRWLDALVRADRDETPDGDDLGWYRASGDWHMRDLPDALNAFVITMQGRLFAR